ncbi:hypothetical protein KI387_017228, partial [Taxus chinensis]
MDSQLRQAFPERVDKSFGGVYMVLVRDLGKLPSVIDKPPYDSNRCAKLLWEAFRTVVTLDK